MYCGFLREFWLNSVFNLELFLSHLGMQDMIMLGMMNRFYFQGTLCPFEVEKWNWLIDRLLCILYWLLANGSLSKIEKSNGNPNEPRCRSSVFNRKTGIEITIFTQQELWLCLRTAHTHTQTHRTHSWIRCWSLLLSLNLMILFLTFVGLISHE